MCAHRDADGEHPDAAESKDGGQVAGAAKLRKDGDQHFGTHDTRRILPEQPSILAERQPRQPQHDSRKANQRQWNEKAVHGG